MNDINLGRINLINSAISVQLETLAKNDRGSGPAPSVIQEEQAYVQRIPKVTLPFDLYRELKDITRYVGVTENFRSVIDTFKTPEGETPPGFRIEFKLDAGGVLRVDLVRDISYDKNGQKRPTKFLFSADRANPYEVAEIHGLIANLTCNPGIIYDLFINNPQANVGNRFKTRDEVMEEIGRILGPGCDISVELNNPFEQDWKKLLEEAEKFREMLTPYRVVIKVPHTGPVNTENVNELLSGDKTFHRRFDQGATKDFFHGHNLALFLSEHGFRINFTLMFEPYQTALALPAKPYFINNFIRHRQFQGIEMKHYLDLYRRTDDSRYLNDLRAYMLAKDYFSAEERDIDPFQVKEAARRILEYRQANTAERYDGLDGVRHNIRLLRSANLPDTRLIICSMEGDHNYPDIDRLLTEKEFEDMTDRVVITAVPAYLAQFTSCNQVVSYQRRFMNAAKGQK